MPLSKIKTFLILAFAGLNPLLASAEDIDLFQGGEAITGNRPNVLIIIDNSANWARSDQQWPDGIKQGEAELNALIKVVSQQSSSIRMGLMMFNEAQETNGGGYVRFGLRKMNQTFAVDSSGNALNDSISNAKKLQTILSGIKPSFNSPREKVSAAQSNYSNVMYEAYRYFNGDAMYSSPYNGKRDYLGNGAYNVSPYTAGNVYNNALTGETQTQYQSPLTVDVPCAKNYIIFIGNGFPSKDTDPSSYGDARINELFNRSQIYSSSKTNFADEWARFLSEHGVNAPCTGTGAEQICADGRIVTHTIDVFNAKQDTEQSRLLESMATAGGGNYYVAKNEEAIVSALNSILNDVQAVDSIYTSASLPVSVNTQGTYLNQIYMGVFRPDQWGGQRWMGNLKQYRFGIRTNTEGKDELYLADSTVDRDTGLPTPAVNNTKNSLGFIRQGAKSYWTYRNEANPFWAFKPSGVGGEHDSPDGDLVEKGGAAQRLRDLGPDARTVYTCTSQAGCASNSTMESFSTSNTTLVEKIVKPGVDVSLTRQGTKVTGTLSSSINLTAPTDIVSISGASVAAYNSTWTVTPSADNLSFTFQITETPVTPATGSGMTVSTGAPVERDILSGQLTYNNDPESLQYGQAQVSLAAHGFIQDQSVTIAGADDAAYNGTYSISVLDDNNFLYTPALLTGESPSPVNSATGSDIGTVRCNGKTFGLRELYRESGLYGSTVVAVTSSKSDQDCKTGNSATIDNVTVVAGYNGTFEVMGTNKQCPKLYGISSYTNNQTFCFTIAVESTTVIPVSPATGTITATGTPTRNIVSISRTEGDAQNKATVTVVTKQDHGFSAASEVTISGADQPEYNGTKTTTADSLKFADAKTITFVLTTGPATPPTGSKATQGYQLPSAGIDWIRGKDNKDDENRNGSLTDVRASIHGDVLHSRPLIVNYGDTTGLVAYYGANDGTLRAVKAGNTGSDGRELWSFISSEHYDTLGRLYHNKPMVKYPNTPADLVPAPAKRNYYFDGNIGVYQAAQLEKTHIFAAMRRGGRALYALDVSSPTSPKFLWKRSHRDEGFSELGLTFSEPKVAAIKWGNESVCDLTKPDTYRLVLVFGAGYDAAEEDKPAGEVRSPNTGRGVFVLDAMTGDIVKFLAPTNAGKQYSFAADVTFLDADSDTCVDRIYAVDTGGNIHRYDLPTSEKPSWDAYHIAKLGDVEEDGGSNDRKFLYPVDGVIVYENNNPVVYLMGGTGDREAPRDTLIKNHFFMIKDTIPVGTASQPTDYPRRFGELTQVTVFDNNSDAAIDPEAEGFKGWYLPLSRSGEKSINAPLTVAGITYFGTNTPKVASNQCSPNLGDARGYAVNFLNGTSGVGDRDQNGTIDESDLYADFIGGGLPPSPVTGVVKIDDKYVRFVIGTGGNKEYSSAIEGHEVQANPNSNRSRVYWYFRKDQ